MTNSPPFIDGIGDTAQRYDHFIIDIFGVIHDGIRPFPQTFNTLMRLKDEGKQTCLLSNSPRLADGAAGQMEMMGLPRDLYDHIITSGQATHEALKNRGDELGDDCWFIGTGIVEETVAGLGLNLLDGPEEASFILNSIPGTESSDADAFKAQLQMAVDRGLPMICANPDLVVNIGTALYECAGTFAAYYEDIGGKVIYHGKPHAPVYEMCHELLGTPETSKICAIGDSFHTDITGANNFGIDSIINLVGIHYEEVLSGRAIDQRKLNEMLSRNTAKPTYMMHGFNW